MNRCARISVLLLGLALAGCTSMRPVGEISPTGIAQAVAPGDQVRIVLRDGRQFDLDVDRVDGESLTGTADSGRRFRIRYSAVRTIQVEDVDAAKTAGAGAAVYVVTGLVATLLFAEMMEDFGEGLAEGMFGGGE